MNILEDLLDDGRRITRGIVLIRRPSVADDGEAQRRKRAAATGDRAGDGHGARVGRSRAARVGRLTRRRRAARRRFLASVGRRVAPPSAVATVGLAGRGARAARGATGRHARRDGGPAHGRRTRIAAGWRGRLSPVRSRRGRGGRLAAGVGPRERFGHEFSRAVDDEPEGIGLTGECRFLRGRRTFSDSWSDVNPFRGRR